VTGTCVGGGTFLGLSNLITGINDFEKVLDLSNQGDDRKVDLFVQDIYEGKDTPNLKLDSSSLAISFGKMADVSNIK
jgi:type II pantothenate kinase